MRSSDISPIWQDIRFTQTVFHNLAEIRDIESIKQGYGKGSFIVIKAIK